MQNVNFRRSDTGRAIWASHRPVIVLFLIISAGISGLYLPAERLILWFGLPIVVARVAWSRTERLTGDKASSETSRITDFCVSGLAASGAALLVLVATITLTTSLADLGAISSLKLDTWSSSPELLRGLVAVGAVLLATGWTMWILFHRRERARRERARSRYWRLNGSLQKRLEAAVGLARIIRSETSSSKFPYVQRGDLPVRQRERALEILRKFEPSFEFRLQKLAGLNADLAAIGALSLDADHPIDLRELLTLARADDPALEPLRRNLLWLRDAMRTLDPHALESVLPYEQSDASLIAELLDHPLDRVGLLAEEDDLNAIRQALGRLEGLSRASASASLAELVSQEWLGEELCSDAEYLTRWRKGRPRGVARFGAELYFWVGVGCVTVAPAALIVMSTTSHIDAAWLDTILSVCAIVGAALLTLYAVLREASLDGIEGFVEDALESSGRITVLADALLRTIDLPAVTFVTKHYLGPALDLDEELFTSADDALFSSRNLPSTFGESVEKLLDWVGRDARAPTTSEVVHFLPRNRLTSDLPASNTRLRRAQLLRFELPEEDWLGDDFSGLSRRYFFATELDLRVSEDGRLDPRWDTLPKENPSTALHLLFVDDGPPSPANFIAVAYEPSDPLTGGPWAKAPSMRPALLAVRREGRLQVSYGALTLPVEGGAASSQSREARVRRLTASLRREAEKLQLRELLDLLDLIDRADDWMKLLERPPETVGEVDGSNAAALLEADFSSERDRFVRLIDALKRFQNRNISPLERFTRFDGAITSEADVLQFVLEECEPPIHR